MGDVIDFPEKAIDLENDAYYRFIRNVLSTADSCGFELPFTVESAAKHVYEQTRDSSQLAKFLKDQPEIN